jgi:hypothetical protein
LLKNQGLRPTFKWRRNFRRFKGAGASIENTTIKLHFNRYPRLELKMARYFPAKSLTSFTFTASQLTAKQQQPPTFPAEMSFTFDAPVFATASAYDKAHRLKSRGSRLPPRALTASIASSSSFLDNVSHRVRNSFRRSNTSDSSNPPSMPSSAASKPSKPVSAAESPFFHLPLELRETIYGLVARRETLHIMMKRRPNRLLHPLVHRRCRAGGDLDECVLHDCKRFLAEGGQGCYFGSFDTVSGLLWSCRGMYALIPSFSYCYQALSGKTSPVIDDRPKIPGGQQFPLHPKHLRIWQSHVTHDIQEDGPPVLAELHKFYLDQFAKRSLQSWQAYSSVQIPPA